LENTEENCEKIMKNMEDFYVSHNYTRCLRSHCGISKSQMVNLIPTCIVSSKEKNYFRMILLNSEKQYIYMYKGRRDLIWERSSHIRKITRPTGVRVHYEVRRAPMSREFVLKTSAWVRVYS
jgi:hypothetical protein